MNRAYRHVWSAAKEAWVVAAEIVKGKGGRPAVTMGRGLRLPAHVMALEPRFMFDAAAAATADAMADRNHDAAAPAPAVDKTASDSHDSQADIIDALSKTVVMPVADANVIAAGAGVAPADGSSDQLDAAVRAAQEAVRTFLSGKDATDLFALFSGQQQTPSAQWLAAAENLRADVLAGRYDAEVELLSNDQIGGIFAAFTAKGPNGGPTIFVNKDWLAAGPSQQAVHRVLVEEIGHSFDHALNGGKDTVGDEGEAFVSAVMNFDLSDADRQRIGAEDDHSTIYVGGRAYEVEEAAITFSKVYQGTPSSWSEEANQITTFGSAITGTNFRFTSATPSDPYFSGNNVSGHLSYTDGSGNAQSIYGVISRLVKTGNTVEGLYFYAPGADGQINGVNDSAYIFCLDPTKFNGSTTYRTSSDPVDTALNKLIVPNSAPVARNDTATVLEDQSVTGNVLTNDTDANYDTLTVTGFTVGGSAGTVNQANTISGVGSITLNSNGSYTFTPVANYAGPVPVVKYTVSDGTATATGNLSISVTPVNDAPAGSDKTITTKEDIGYTFSAADFGFSDPNDSPANSLSSVVITTLPGSGTLTLNNGPVTQGQEIAVADITKLVYTPAANATGSLSFTFQVRDSGGTANDGVNLDPSANTITFNVAAVNDAPTANTDTATAVEAGGANNGTGGTDPAGNVLSNDTDPDSGDSKSVTSAGSAATVTTAVGTSTAIAGTYGTLTISSDGSYTYAVDNSNAAVQALRLSDNTLADTFTYTMQDGGGLKSSSTLTVTIQGANDTPSATNDSNTAKESIAGSNNYSGSDTTGHTATGNVLTNDTDVDRNGETKSIAGISIGGSATVGNVAVNTGTATLSFTGDSGFTANLSNRALYVNIGETYRAVYASNGTTQITLSSKQDQGSNNWLITLSDKPAYYYDAGGNQAIADVGTFFSTNTAVGFESSTNTTENTSGMKTATVNVAQTTGSTTISSLSGLSGTFAVGMTVSGTGVPSSTTISSITYTAGVPTSIVLDRELTSTAGGAFTFSASGSVGSALTGGYGTLTLGSDGSYTYTPTANNANLSEGQSGVDSFTYQMKDASNAASTATLSITVLGSGTNDPHAAADTATAIEAGGANNATPGSNPTGSVISNDTPTVGTLSVVAGRAVGASSETAINSGSYIDFTGLYGTLRLNSDGTYTYTVDNSNATVQALRTNSDTLTDTFVYRIQNTATPARQDSSTLTVTIQGANDAPVAVADTANASEAGGIGNANAGYNPTGNVLANDTDVDSGDTRTVSAITGGTVGQAKAGSYGSLTLNANGSYTYTVDNSNSSVQALAAGATLTDTFTYTVQDAGGLTSSSTLTVTINGANDAPVNTLPGTQSLKEYQSLSITGLSVNDADGNLQTVQLTVTSGKLNIGNLNGATITAGANDSATFTLSGNQTQINSALATLSYQGNAYFSGSDTLTVVSRDSNGLEDTDTMVITVGSDDRALTVNSVTVNEASPYAVFTVTGVAGQKVSLALGNTSTTGDTDATSGADFSPNLEYYDGSQWQAYTGSPVAIPTGGTTLLVRTAIMGDMTNEGAETFTLAATNTAGTAYTGTATIVDDGTGTKYPGTVSGATPDTNTSNLDDDRPLTVNSIEVNEASPFAVFTVEGVTGQSVTLALQSATATVGTDTGSGLQYYDGNAWQTYSGAVSIPTGGKLFVRTTITNDGTYEGPESFGLAAANTGGATTIGTAVILDDGTGTKYTGDISGGTAQTSGTGLDSDLNLTVTAATPINEASTYAMFTVEGTAGQNLDLELDNTYDSSDRDASIAGFTTMQYSTNGGSTWTTYDSTHKPVIPGSSGTGKVYVRVDISSEGDSVYEGPETFTLKAVMWNTNAPTQAASTIATITDDGTGLKYPGTVTGVTPDSSNSGLDSDKPTVSVSSPTVTEGQSAVFTVSLDHTSATNVSFTPTLSNGSATIGTDTALANTLEVSTDGGTNWSTVSGAVTIAAGQSSIQLRLATIDDALSESTETFTLSTGAITGAVTNAGAVSGTASITDNDASANHPPTGTDKTVSTNEDTALTLSAADFGFSDADSHTLAAVRIDTIATAGTLYLNGVAVIAGQVITKTDIDANKLTFTPATNANGNGYATFTFSVKDSSGDFDSSPNTITVNVTAVNDAPTITSGTTGTVAENAATSTVVYTVTATDVDAGDTRSYSLSGTDANLFNINAATGAVTLKNPANFEVKPSYDINVIATDAGGLTDTKAVTINVSDTTAPTVTVTAGQYSLKAGETTTLTFTFSEVPVGFDAADVSVESGTLGTITATSDPKVFTASYTPAADTEDAAMHVAVGTGYTDLAGNSGTSGSTDLAVDTKAPVMPVITRITDNVSPIEDTVANGGYTNDTTPTLTGTAEPGSTVNVYDNGALVATVVADGSGTWSYTSAPLADGTAHGYTVTATDAAGNVSAPSAAYAVTIDTTAPAAPTVVATSTLSTVPVISGGWDATPGNVLEVTINGFTYRPGDGNLTVSGSSWTLAVPAANALTAGVTYEVSARVTDRAGNSAGDASSVELAVLSPPPPPVAVTAPATTTSAPAAEPPPAPAATQQAPAETASPDSFVAILATQSQPASGVVSVAAGPEAGTQSGLMAVLSPNRQDVSAGEEATFQLPAGTFRQTDPSATTRMEAAQADGTPLPAWIRFNASDGTFSGVAPAGAAQTLDVRVVARDDHGNTAAVRFEISVNENASRAGNNALTATPVAPPVPAAAATVTPITTSAPAGASAAPPADSAPSREGQTPAPGDSAATSRQPSPPSVNVAAPVVVLQPAAAGSYLVTRGGEEHGGAALFVRLDPPPQEATVNRLSTFQLPQGIFVTTSPDVQVTLKASQNDGSPLPSWLTFNPSTGTFIGTPPPGTSEAMEVKLTARDSNGNETSAVFRLRINQQEDQGASLAPSDRPAPEASAALDAQYDDGDVERVSTGDPRHAPQRLHGRPSLAEQFARHGRRGLELERQQMVRTLQRGFAARQTISG